MFGIIILTQLSLCGCQRMEEIENYEYPVSLTRSQASASIDLSETTFAVLSTGKRVKLPWCNGAETSTLDDVRCDVKESDGWNVLYTNVEIEGHNSSVTVADDGLNYILLYNRNTGFLKGFLYVEKTGDNNNARWLLTGYGGTTLFNFAPYFALPINSEDSPQQVSISLASKNGIVQGFEKGWNCFMLELAYDENSINEKLSISGYALNQTSYHFNGAFNSIGNGTIVSNVGGSSGMISGIASAVGNAAKAWVKNNTDKKDKPIKYLGEIAGNVLDKGITGFISSGLSRIFGSMSGTSRSISDLQFTTNGSVSLEGTSTTPMTGYIPPISGIPLNSLGENLGIWNLEETPIWGYYSFANLKKVLHSNNEACYIYTINCAPSYKIKKNPALEGSMTPILKAAEYNKSIWYPSNYGMGLPNKDLWVQQLGTRITLYSDSATTINNMPLSYDILTVNFLPTRVCGENIPAADIANSRYNIRDKVVMQIVNAYNTANGQKTNSIKTFVPKQMFIQNAGRPYGWTLAELIEKGYYSNYY